MFRRCTRIVIPFPIIFLWLYRKDRAILLAKSHSLFKMNSNRKFRTELLFYNILYTCLIILQSLNYDVAEMKPSRRGPLGPDITTAALGATGPNQPRRAWRGSEPGFAQCHKYGQTNASRSPSSYCGMPLISVSQVEVDSDDGLENLVKRQSGQRRRVCMNIRGSDESTLR